MWKKLVYLFALIMIGIIAWKYRESILWTNGLEYPNAPRALTLEETQSVIIERGAITTQYEFHLAPGAYQEVLQNEKGAFFLAPERGFLEVAPRRNGLAVGGVYLSNDETLPAYVWYYMLKNENRSVSNPETSRTLSREEDQPEREFFLDPDWYENKRFDLLGRPMVDTDFEVLRGVFVEGE